MQPKAGSGPPGPPAPAFGSRPEAVPRHGAAESFAVDPVRLGLASGLGKPLADTVRGQMEGALHADFSTVRVHVGPQPQRIGALAFTVGNDIYFAPGRFQPGTLQGRQLLGHELAHVLQQRQGRARVSPPMALAVLRDQLLEAEAERLGHRAAVCPVKAQPAAGLPHKWIAQARQQPVTPRLVAGAGHMPARPTSPWTGRPSARVLQRADSEAKGMQKKMMILELAMAALEHMIWIVQRAGKKGEGTMTDYDIEAAKIYRQYEEDRFIPNENIKLVGAYSRSFDVNAYATNREIPLWHKNRVAVKDQQDTTRLRSEYIGEIIPQSNASLMHAEIKIYQNCGIH